MKGGCELLLLSTLLLLFCDCCCRNCRASIFSGGVLAECDAFTLLRSSERQQQQVVVVEVVVVDEEEEEEEEEVRSRHKHRYMRRCQPRWVDWTVPFGVFVLCALGSSCLLSRHATAGNTTAYQPPTLCV